MKKLERNTNKHKETQRDLFYRQLFYLWLHLTFKLPNYLSAWQLYSEDELWKDSEAIRFLSGAAYSHSSTFQLFFLLLLLFFLLHLLLNFLLSQKTLHAVCGSPLLERRSGAPRHDSETQAATVTRLRETFPRETGTKSAVGEKKKNSRENKREVKFRSLSQTEWQPAAPSRQLGLDAEGLKWNGWVGYCSVCLSDSSHYVFDLGFRRLHFNVI